MKRSLLPVAAGAIAALAAFNPAHADNTPTPDASVVQPSTSRTAGVSLTIAPFGQISAHANGQSESADLETSTGIRPYIDFPLSPHLTLGIAPQVIFNVKTPFDTASAKQFDFMARATYRLAKSGKLTPFGYASAGWSTLRLPVSQVGHPSGFTFDVGGGVMYEVSPMAFLSAGLGYQSSAMGLTVQGDTVGIRTSFMHVGIGVGTLL